MAEQYRAAVIGCGGMSHAHAKNYVRAARTVLVAAADIDPQKFQKYREDYQVQAFYTDYQEMLRKEKPDLVSVCTWPALHPDPVIEAARGGVKGVLCEKPMALDLKRADEMISECERAGVKLAIGHQLRSDGMYITAKSVLDSGSLGRIQRIHGVCHGADLISNATHTVDMMNFLNGDAPIEWLIGQVDNQKKDFRYGHHVENYAIGYYGAKNGVVLFIESGDHGMPGYHHLYLHSDEGEMELNHPGGPPLRYRAASTRGNWVEPPRLPGLNPIDELVAWIEGGPPHRSAGRLGRAAHEILMAIFESSRTRRLVTLPLQERENPFFRMIQAGEI
ncbi:MAG: Gfo/Idh/MocA family oxidoreductase [Planctomycetes bacterium]|nr:Gfo/Idh/MocA family oxidoreductase [Planctomycetota bacterium]